MEPQCSKPAIQPRGAQTRKTFIQLPIISPKMAFKSEVSDRMPAPTPCLSCAYKAIKPNIDCL